MSLASWAWSSSWSRKSLIISAADDPDLVGHDGGFPDVVGNEHCGDALFLADLEDELLHLGSGQGIKGSEGFVKKQELGRGQEGSG